MDNKKLTKAEYKAYLKKRKAEKLAKSKASDKRWQDAIRKIGHDFVEDKDPKMRKKQLKPRTSLGKVLIR